MKKSKETGVDNLIICTPNSMEISPGEGRTVPGEQTRIPELDQGQRT
ncbi:MAG: hypothetical protein HN745_26295 [Deltaproteobacteria bacterium]|nr:hypothetical protein [Deltaproteobacteria bacterium]MBT4642266.1 hypothetical protein [Deltaproteobacteria bacterium]MBT6610912.1 hypothetical protein [Deltaproteobacteria bacterium]MBT7715252.1 hypothetical protein [Deltaproteobacteria bacterium]